MRDSSYISGKWCFGRISDVNSYAGKRQRAGKYSIMVDEKKGVPNVPEALVFDDKEDAKEWINELDRELINL